MAEEYEREGALSKKKERTPPAHHGAHHGGHSASTHAHLHFHRHEGGVTAHVMHPDGGHEIHHFHPDDHDGMASLLQEHMGAGAGMPPGAGGEAPTGEPPEHLAEGASPEQERQEQAV